MRNILLLSLIGYWAVLGFKPAYAGGTKTLSGTETADNLQIGGGNPDSELFVTDSASTTNAVIETGGTASYQDNSSGYDTRVDGGIVSVEDNASLTDTTIRSGSVSAAGSASTTNTTIQTGGTASYQDNSSGYNTVVDGGIVSVEDNASLTDTTILSGRVDASGTSTISDANIASNGELYISENSTASNITMSSGYLEVTSSKTATDITISGGQLSVFGNDSSVSDVTLNGGAATLGVNSSADNVTINAGTFSVTEASSITNSTINGGNLTLEGEGKSENITVNGGTFDIKQESTAKNITIDGGTVTVETDSYIEHSSVSNGGSLVINGTDEDDNYAEAFEITVDNGGIMTVQGDLTAVHDTTVMSDGTVNLLEEVLVADTTIDGGVVNASGYAMLTDEDGVNTIKNDGKLTLENNAYAENFTIEQGSVAISDDAQLSGVKVTGNADVEVGYMSDTDLYNYGGVLSDVTVENGGNLWLHNKEGTTLGAGSNITIKEGGKLTSNKYENGSYSTILIVGLYVEQGGKFDVSTDDNIADFNTYDKNGTVHEGSIGHAGGTGNAHNIVVGDGSSLTVKENDIADTITVEGGVLNINNGAQITNSTVTDGTFNIDAGGKADWITFDGNSSVFAETGSNLSNISLLGNTTVNIEDYSSLWETLTVGKDVVGLDASQLFVPETNLYNLTLTGGLNSAFNDGIITNDNGAHNLNLENGDYAPEEVNGWETVNLENASLSLRKDLGLFDGALNIDPNSNLYVTGNVNINGGDVYNDGTIDLVTKSSSANDTLTINGDYTGSTGSKLKLNIDVASAVSDKIIITGKASGNTSVYLTSLNNGSPLRDDVLFAQANSSSGEGVFKIHRVEGSYYQWNTVFNDNKWYASVKNAIKDDKYVLVPEAAAYYGLIDNTFMQTSSLGQNLRNNIAISEYKKVPCKNVKRGENAICRSNRPVFSGWLAPATTSITVDSPFVYDADISGFDGGLDLLSNGSTKLGLLASYRKGTYNYDENGDKYEIIGQAETTINSYLAGAYLRHDGQNWSTILAGYAGILDADISTADDVNTSISGTTYGATLDVSYIYKNMKGLRIEPGVRISYTAVEMDSVEDNAGKTQEFDNASRTEIEAGIKFAKRWEFPDSRAEIFIKPSIAHIMDDTSDFVIDEENSLAQADDRTVAKLSAGISFDMTSSLSASLAGSYSVGDDYTNSSGNLSVMYRF